MNWIILLLVSLALGGATQFYIKSTFKKWSRVSASNGLTGAQVAQTILSRNGIAGTPGQAGGVRAVGVAQAISGSLSDHYDPRTGIVALSDSVYGESTVAATAVAAHEVGHALQTADGYIWGRARTALVPVVNLGGNIAWILIFIGIIMTALRPLFWMGIACFALTVVFQIVTLPVEFNASHRGLVQLREAGLLNANELGGARQVLTSAALTYVAAALVSVMYLLYYLGLGGRRD
jgi:Zn-dependent membrane protease YugP